MFVFLYPFFPAGRIKLLKTRNSRGRNRRTFQRNCSSVTLYFSDSSPSTFSTYGDNHGAQQHWGSVAKLANPTPRENKIGNITKNCFNGAPGSRNERKLADGGADIDPMTRIVVNNDRVALASSSCVVFSKVNTPFVRHYMNRVISIMRPLQKDAEKALEAVKNSL